jgi:hypothetical protein
LKKDELGRTIPVIFIFKAPKLDRDVFYTITDYKDSLSLDTEGIEDLRKFVGDTEDYITVKPIEEEFKQTSEEDLALKNLIGNNLEKLFIVLVLILLFFGFIFIGRRKNDSSE